MAMGEVVQAVEALGQFKPFQAEALAWAPEIARIDFGPRGVFMGYDFHLTPNGPKLIEVNTNAGGAFLNAILAQAWVACCPEVQALVPQPPAKFEDAVWNMFEAEWRLQRRAGRPRVIAIVDDAPEGQYLYPEFLLAQAFFQRRGVEAVIADPKSLRFWRGPPHARRATDRSRLQSAGGFCVRRPGGRDAAGSLSGRCGGRDA